MNQVITQSRMYAEAMGILDGDYEIVEYIKLTPNQLRIAEMYKLNTRLTDNGEIRSVKLFNLTKDQAEKRIKWFPGHVIEKVNLN